MRYPDPFDSCPAQYDAWYDENPEVFRGEIDLIRDWMKGFPSLEIGVGTGRFASALGIEFGLDRARRALASARKRGTIVVAGDAVALPFRKISFALVGMFFTLEFLPDPIPALGECRRVLARGGRLILLHFLPGSPVAEKVGRGFYAGIRNLYEPGDIREMAGGFCLADQREWNGVSALLFVKA